MEEENRENRESGNEATAVSRRRLLKLLAAGAVVLGAATRKALQKDSKQ